MKRWVCIAVVLAGCGVGFGETPATAPAATESSKQAGQNWFGVAVENIPPQIARQLKLRKDQGLMVMAVLSGTPAERAGMKADDILIEIDASPLTSQEELARAANATIRMGDAVVAKSSHIAFLRDGDRREMDITPGPRPANMIAMGGGLHNFTAHEIGEQQQAAGVSQPFGVGLRNYAFSSGTTAQIGPGYKLNVTGDASAMTSKSIQAIVSKGQTVILSQETDLNGTVKNTITVGGTTYAVEAGRLDILPADLRPLGEQMLAGGVNGGESELEMRVRLLEEENQKLQGKMAELIDALKKDAERQAAGDAGGKP